MFFRRLEKDLELGIELISARENEPNSLGVLYDLDIVDCEFEGHLGRLLGPDKLAREGRVVIEDSNPVINIRDSHYKGVVFEEGESRNTSLIGCGKGLWAAFKLLNKTRIFVLVLPGYNVVELRALAGSNSHIVSFLPSHTNQAVYGAELNWGGYLCAFRGLHDLDCGLVGLAALGYM